MEQIDAALFGLGFQKAVNRLMTGGERPYHLVQEQMRRFEQEGADWVGNDEISTSGTFISLFEALHWAATFDDRLRRDWPRGNPKRWFDAFDGGEVMLGVRFARNRVHHQWAKALAVAHELHDPMTRSDVWSIVWARSLPPAPERFADPVGEQVYAERLAGEPVTVSLTALLPVVISAVTILKVHGRVSYKAPTLPFQPGEDRTDLA